ncbi:hypothetical protein JI735_31700 [Paenibacillus sonchi]|uniref:Uncharacterized protein n=1 Tax=Paenibacillus sonchi TaxID=373687 RepID=A0A974SCJ9_9BACL|nr:hypothetical protein [Paenibacillus sonchi]QQZ60942.1 hypothetical protein JI735_31700 [Paenibacillus sonchi]
MIKRTALVQLVETVAPSSRDSAARLGLSFTWRTISRESYSNSLSGKRDTNLLEYPILGQMKWH